MSGLPAYSNSSFTSYMNSTHVKLSLFSGKVVLATLVFAATSGQPCGLCGVDH